MASRGTPPDPRARADQRPRYQRHWYAEPAPELAWCVERYWAASWNYRDQPPYQQLMLPYPNVHLSFINDAPGLVRGGRAAVRVQTASRRRPSVRGGVSARLLPALPGAPVATITDRSIDAHEVFGPDLPRPAEATSAAAQRQIVEGFLRVHAPPPDPDAEQAAGIVALVAATPELTRVEDLAGRLGTSVRWLQRLFAEHVGVGPKWVIRRYRLHEVTERMARGGIDWARLAVELGYSDQAHLTRDFTTMVGESPTRYAQRYPG